MPDFPLWFWIVLGVMNALSLLWMFLVLRDVKQELYSQLWIVGEQNRDVLKPARLIFLRGSYALSILILSILSVLLIPVVL